MTEQTARDLIAHRNYVKPDGSSGITRKTTATQEWVFGASGGNEFMIKFDKNFVKKHLFTYSKKTSEVAGIATQLWEAAGKPPNRDLEFWLAAELTKFNGKVTKVLKARGEASVCTCGHLLAAHTCVTCNHARSRHLTGSGNPCACKEPLLPAPGQCGCTDVHFKCREAGCACNNFVSTQGNYAAKRAASLKGDNPLAGAATTVNTCLVLDRVSMADFKSVVISAIQAAETNAFTWPTAPAANLPMPPVPNNFAGASTKHVRWDFGAANLGCVVNADLSQPTAVWGKAQGVEVCMVKTGVTPTGHGGQQYQYCVYHLHASF